MSPQSLLERAEPAASIDEDGLFNTIVTASFLSEDGEALIFDLGQERRAQIQRDEFGEELPFSSGDDVAILVEDEQHGAWLGSVKKAEKLAIWRWLESLQQSGDPVDGFITAENKGGLSVDIGVRAFLPRSHVDLHRVKDCTPYLGRSGAFQVIEFDKKRGNVVVSRKNLLEKAQKADKRELISSLETGQKYQGVVRNLTDYGAFVDIGGIDGLLHVTNMSWGRVDHPSELVRPGDTVDVVVLEWDPKKKRLGLGRKQLLADPWADVEERFKPGEILDGKVVSIADFGAFVSVAPGVEGLVHVTELSWTRRINHPKEVLNRDQNVKVKVLSIDPDKRRISLSIKAMEENPWVTVAENYPEGTRMSGPIRNITDFGLFVEVEEGVEGLVHVSDISWTDTIDHPKNHFEIGQDVEFLILGIDVDAQRMSLGIKQLESNPWEDAEKIAVVGQKIEAKITKLTEFGAFAEIVPGVEGLIHISELSEERINKASEVVRPGQKVTALVMSYDRSNERIGLSMKRDELEADSSTLKEYSDDDSASATLGDIDIFRERLGLEKDAEQQDVEPEEKDAEEKDAEQQDVEPEEKDAEQQDVEAEEKDAEQQEPEAKE